MYRKFLNTYLSRSEQLKQNKANSDKSIRYCNFLCQEFLPVERFYKDSESTCCIKCSNYLIIAKKMVKDEKITYEQFKKDPMIIYKKKVTSDNKKLCDKCNEEKFMDCFDAARAVCKECRLKQSIERDKKDLNKEIEIIEKVKDSKEQLTETLRKISVSKIQEILKYYKITRLSKDKKHDSIAKMLKYFEQLQSPYKCLGNCGFDLTETFSYCIACRKNPSKHEFIEEKNLKFKENIEEFLENKLEITSDECYDYNITNIKDICSYLDIKKNNGHANTKQHMVNLINEKLKQKREEESKKSKIHVNKLVFEDFTILSRDDGFIDATQMCQVRNKTFYDWFRLDSTKEFIKELEEDLKLENKSSGNHDLLQNNENQSNIKLIDVKNGRSGYSFVHPDLAVQLAMWIDKKFAIKVSRFVRELAITGSCTLEPKTSKQLLELQKENEQLKIDKQNLQISHEKLLEKKHYYKFKQGPVFYLISDSDSKSVKYKPGIETVDINVRLQQHRSTTPCIKLEMLVYTKDCSLMEKNILTRYKTKRDHINHEWIYGISKEHIITSIKTQLEFLEIQYTIEENLEEYNSQIEPF